MNYPSAQTHISSTQRNGHRFYLVAGHTLPSVTTILSVIAKPALIPWARNTVLETVRRSLLKLQGAPIPPALLDAVIEDARRSPHKVMAQAADFGTKAHALIAAILQGEKPEIPPELAPAIESFKAWQKNAGLDIEFAETEVRSLAHGYAGTLDALACRGDRWVVLDWKTGNGIYPEHALQVAAYAKAFEETVGVKVGEAWIIRLGKTSPTFNAQQVMDIEAAFGTFLAVLGLWRGLQEMGEVC